MELHKSGRSYLYHISEANYDMISFIEMLREYIIAILPEVDIRIYHIDNYTISISSKEMDDLFDVLMYVLPDINADVKTCDNGQYWYVNFDILNMVEVFGNTVEEYGADWL